MELERRSLADEAKHERRSDVVVRSSRRINVDDVISDVIQSQESAGSLHSRRKWKRRRREDPVASYSAFSRCYLKIATAKRCRLHKLIRQRFALAIKIQQEDFALFIQQSQALHPVDMNSRRKQQQHPVESSYESAVAIYIQSQALHPVDMDSQTQRIKDISRR
ncbi:protein arginine N-methyltransferase PRMT10 [Dorcoceras hygrometricum]|uniref:Protein arginine N-methyltransferase PRMT10 n=1 Tax=Dorcoceras hygrometricum TaxID=472368 RepID=A0A2Z7CR94_9LAMI|nr:protein arginine N-methyltransferase PRMT10 [Dorcoceras hygrometricum]